MECFLSSARKDRFHGLYKIAELRGNINWNNNVHQQEILNIRKKLRMLVLRSTVLFNTRGISKSQSSLVGLNSLIVISPNLHSFL